MAHQLQMQFLSIPLIIVVLGYLINDRIGPTQENTISADLSYTIPTSETVKLSFWYQSNLFNLDVSRLNPVDGIP
jgi:hypothetical protein